MSKNSIGIEDLVSMIGSARKLAKHLGKEPHEIRRIRKNGGSIPKGWLEPILNMSERLGLPITADQLIRGLDIMGAHK